MRTALRDFIARDLMFLFGGSLVLGSLAYSVSSLKVITDNGLVFVLSGGVAYVLGWVVQDIFCIIGFVTIKPYCSPKKFYLWLYKRLLGDEWEKIDPSTESLRERKARVYEQASDRNLVEIERFISLKQVASSISPASLLASITLFARYLSTGRECEFDLMAAIVLLAMSLLLVPLNRIKAAQQAQYIWNLSNHLSKHPEVTEQERDDGA